jgi:hypothetical protein
MRVLDKRVKKILKGRPIQGFIFVAFFCGTLLTSGSEGRTETKPSLGILPFFAERVENPARGVVLCPLCKRAYQSGQVLPGSENILTRLLYQKMEALGTFKVLPLEKVEAVLSSSVKKHFEEKPIPSSIQIGKELNVDFI